MTRDLLADIWASCRGQLRRSPGGVAFLWLSLAVAVSALLIGFGHAERIRARDASHLPGEMERLAYVQVNTVSQEVGGAPWVGFTAPFLMGLVDDGVVSGFFFKHGPMQIVLNGTEQRVYLIVYHGWMPWYGTKDAEVLRSVADEGGLAVTQALAAASEGFGEGASIYLADGQPLQVKAVVGHDPDLDPQWWVMVPGALAPPDIGSNRVGFYDASPALVDAMKERLSALEPSVSLQLQLLSGFEEHRSDIESGRSLALLARLGALLVGVVAIANLASFSTTWLLHRSYSFGLRRALGANISLVAVYLIAEILFILAPALVLGIGLTAIFTRYRPAQFILSAVSLSSIGLAAFVILVGGGFVGFVLVRLIGRLGPGDLLRRSS